MNPVNKVLVMSENKGHTNFLRKIVIFPIRVYQYCISPLYPARCRFHPSCSQYTAIAIEKHGIIQGIWLGTKRICRCNPWCEGGFDPVPETVIPCKEVLVKKLQWIFSKIRKK